MACGFPPAPPDDGVHYINSLLKLAPVSDPCFDSADMDRMDHHFGRLLYWVQSEIDLRRLCSRYSDTLHRFVVDAADAHNYILLWCLFTHGCDFNWCRPREDGLSQFHMTILNHIVDQHPRKRNFDAHATAALIAKLREYGADPRTVDNWKHGRTMRAALIEAWTTAHINPREDDYIRAYEQLWPLLFPQEPFPNISTDV